METSVTDELAVGVTIAERYTLSKLIGEGGMGAVWAARHEVTGKLVALKFLKGTQEEHRRRFVQEARVAAAIRHPNVVDIHDVFELPDGKLVLVMDLLEGESLSARLARERVLSLAQLAPITLGALAGLGAAHAVGVVHRDMKPDNVFLCQTVTGDIGVKILDFGIAKLTALANSIRHSDAMTQTGSLLGTPLYMAPEQVFGEKDLDHRADFWSLGIVLYECLTGACPIDGDNIGQIFKMISTRGFPSIALRLPLLDPEIAALIDRLLSIRPEDRPDSAREIAEVLSLRMGLPLPPIPEPSWLPEARRSEKKPDVPAMSVRAPAEAATLVDVRVSVSVEGKTEIAPAPAKKPTQLIVLAVGLAIFGGLALGWSMTVTKKESRTPQPLPATPSAMVQAQNPAPSANALVAVPAVTDAETTAVTIASAATALPTPPVTSKSKTSAPSSTTTAGREKKPAEDKPALGPGGIYSDSPY